MKTQPCLLLFLLLAASLPLRAQLTESPQPIGPGSVLFEIDGLSLAVSRDGDRKYKALGVASTVVSFGLTRAIDLQVGADLFLQERIEEYGTRETHSGVGDLSFRAKWAFLKNEYGATAALIPYVRLPTGSGGMGGDSVEGGFILPWETVVGGAVTAGAMLQWDLVRNPDDNGYDTTWLLSGYVQRNLTAGLGLYAEAALAADSTGQSDFAGTLGAGATWTLNPRLSLDYELLRGLNERAADWTHVLRVNWGW